MTSTQARHSPQALHTRTEGSAHDAVRLTGLRKSFGTVDAVKGIDLSIRPPGEIVAFLGPNGAGKTTTIDMILGLSRPTSGEVSVFGMSPRSAIARGLVSAVMQTGGLLKELTVAETVQLTASLYSQSRPVDEVLGESRNPRHLRSPGQQMLRRTTTAIAICDGVAVEPAIAHSRRAHHRHGRRRASGLLVRHPRRRRSRSHCAFCDALPRRGRCLRRPHHPGQARHRGRRRDHRRGQGDASGRTLRATVPGITDELLRAIPNSDAVEVRGESLLVHSGDTDAVARFLLTNTQARDLEIVSRGLEDAFIALTSNNSEGQK